MKKILSTVLALIMFFAVVPATACNEGNNNSSTEGSTSVSTVAPEESTDYLVMEAYSITMFVGETYDLSVKKYDQYGTEQSVEKITYTSDYAEVASVENGKITAKQIGETYVTVTADGINASCFVSVQSGIRGEKLEIRFVEDTLYEGVPAQAYVYVITDGLMDKRLTDITWESSDQTLFTVNEDGKVTAKSSFETATLTAKCIYNDREVVVTKTLKAIAPYYYQTTIKDVRLASNKTYSGMDNTKYTSHKISVERIHLINGTKTMLPQTAFTLEISDETLVETFVSPEGEVTFTAGEKEGKCQVIFKLAETRVKLVVNLQVYNALATIEDMDALSFASYSNPKDLQKSYILVNDIDYNGQIIYPIAESNMIDNKANPRPIGYQWKYLLDFDEAKGYSYLPRSEVGKAGKGLTDGEMLAFGKNNGINPTVSVFSGTFDGNGYSIKNAMLMWAGHYLTNDKRASRMSIFGEMTDATVRNIAFENITIQIPSDTLAYEQPYDISYFQGENGYESGDYANDGTKYRYYGASIAQRTTRTSFENIYLEMDYTRASRHGMVDGALVNWSLAETRFENCVVFVNSSVSNCYALTGNSGENGIYANNLAIGNIGGVAEEKLKLSSGINGQEGNWCYKMSKPTDWKDFFNAEKGENAVDVRSIENTLKTFAIGVWDLTNFNATVGGAPTLIDGCSTNGN